MAKLSFRIAVPLYIFSEMNESSSYGFLSLAAFSIVIFLILVTLISVVLSAIY